MSATDLTMRKLRPFNGRVTLIESAVDDEERASGLIVPVGGIGSTVRRGVILHVDDMLDVTDPRLAPGVPIYYHAHDAVQVADVYLLDHQAILAYETDD